VRKYKFLEHTADIKFKIYGSNRKEIFENAVLAVSEILAKGNKIKSTKKKIIKIKGNNNEKILYSLIDEIIYLLDAEKFITTKAKVKLDKFGLSAELYGDNSKNYKNLGHIKAATYSEMYIKKIKGNWEAQAVVDI